MGAMLLLGGGMLEAPQIAVRVKKTAGAVTGALKRLYKRGIVMMYVRTEDPDLWELDENIFNAPEYVRQVQSALEGLRERFECLQEGE